MKSYSISLAVLCLIVLSVSLAATSGAAARVGGWRDSRNGNGGEIEALARFAVDEHNKKENGILELVRVVKAKEQVVAGILHDLTLEVMDKGKTTIYEAKVWVKPWLNFKQLTEFKPANHGVEMEGNVIRNKGQMEN